MLNIPPINNHLEALIIHLKLDDENHGIKPINEPQTMDERFKAPVRTFEHGGNTYQVAHADHKLPGDSLTYFNGNLWGIVKLN